MNDNKVTLSGNTPEDPNCIGAPAPIDPQTGMHKDYWILSDEERAKGFIRPVRTKYIHVGRSVCGKLLIQRDNKRLGGPRKICVLAPKHKGKCDVLQEVTQPDGSRASSEHLLGGCGVVTVMGIKLAETYARDPDFYGATFCVGCKAHFYVSEFVWDGTDEVVGS